MIEHQAECTMVEREFKIKYVYCNVYMVERAWCVEVIPQTIKNCWSLTIIFSTLVENEIEGARCLAEVAEVEALLEQLKTACLIPGI